MYENVEKFYNDNHYRLIEDTSDGSLRPGKSFTKDVENCIEKFRNFYKANKKDVFSENELMSIIGGVDTNTRSQNLRVMREFGFLNEIGTEDNTNGKFEFTQLFKEFALSDQITGVYILDELYKIKGIDDFSMYFNLLICTLREAAIHGQVILFPDSDDKFKNAVPDISKRNSYRKRIYDIYGYRGRNNEITDDVYSPNLSYMSRAELENLGLLKTTTDKVDGLNCLLLTNNGRHLLQTLDKNLIEVRPDENANIETSAKDQKEKFRAWMSQQKKANGDFYSNNTITSYIGQMERGYASFEKYHDFESVFQIQDKVSLDEYTNYLFNADGFDEFNDKAGNKACSCGLVKYGEFLSEDKFSLDLKYDCLSSNKKPRNRIVFGAPGTGKSFMINEDRKELLGADNESDYERVTFHPDYSYANFVGTYKPVPSKDSDGKDSITYEYVPGPFMRVYVNALKSGRTNNPKPYLLIIEEINRANVAAVFGDTFQLLDRDDSEVSEYPIQASEDIKKYLAKELGGEPDFYSKIKIPNNMFIWATMNSADQGVFPMDTAFKRRWDFTYIGIDDNDKDIQGKYVVLGSNTSQKVEWNKLRKAINHFLTKQKINEDKQLGPYFISRKIVVPENGNEIDRKAFAETFKNKVLMYLFEDAAKQKRPTLFEGCFANSSRYSEICKEFDEKGLGIFSHDISLESEPEDLTIEGATVTATTENAEQ